MTSIADTPIVAPRRHAVQLLDVSVSSIGYALRTVTSNDITLMSFISRGTLGLVLLRTNQAKTAMGSDLGCDIQKPLEKAREVIITRSQFPPYHRLLSLIVLIFVQRTRSLPVSSFFKTEQFGSVSIHPQVQYWCVPRGDGLNSRLTCD